MSDSLEDRSSTKGSLLAVAVLALLTLADNVSTNTSSFALESEPPQTPGFWNLTTTSLILSVISDLIGQPVLMFLTYHYGHQYAVKLNILSIAIASSYSLLSLFWQIDGRAWIPAIAPVFKIIGSGSHATTFLIIIAIREKTAGSLRAALIYTTGAVIVLCQTIASSVTPFLAKQDLSIPYSLSVICCIFAGFITIVDSMAGNPAGGRDWTNNSSLRPLLSPLVANQDRLSVTPTGLITAYSNVWLNKPPMARKSLKLLGWVFLFAAIAKATRPLFTTYIQHRVGITPTGASYLWLIRTVMSLVIFSAVLPIVVILWSKNTSEEPNTINVNIAKISIFLLALGALLIGLAQSKPVLMSGLVINTLGVATDLALLAFAADIVPDEISSSFFLVIAFIESAGTLIGIAVLYPLYQRFLDTNTPLGGIPYYFCAVRIYENLSPNAVLNYSRACSPLVALLFGA
ncbi:hypothetical protein F5Y09DRAFT_173480 [Xylaria sp. FL1042]|nr:hypothetical protein F5Y09DRAFT_173480 [Xylaria sp. FL1042]